MSVSEESLSPSSISRIGWWMLNILQLLFTLAWTAFWIVCALLVLVATGGRRRWPLRMASRIWSPALLGGAGARLQIEGLADIDWSRPYVVVANHQSIIDICVLFRAIPTPLRFVLKQELAQVPFVGQYARAMGMVFIRRSQARQATRRLSESTALFEQGHCLCAFPEGTRSRDGRIGPFKGGVFKLAIEAGIPVLPVSVEGSGDVLPSRGFQVRPGRIRLRFGTPIEASEYRPGQRMELAERSRSAILALHADRPQG